MRVILFSHESDLDGIYSASIGLIRYPQAKTIFLSYGAENFIKMKNLIFSAVKENTEMGMIIISDLGLNDDVIDICTDTFSFAHKNGWQIIWVDHHPWSERAIRSTHPYVQLVLDHSGNKCAADLMYEKFLPGNYLASSLAAMAHSMDFFTKDQYLVPVSELIRYYQTFPDYYDRLSSLCKKSANGILWDVNMQEEYRKYCLLRDSAKEKVYSTMKIKEIGNVNVAFIHSSPYLQSSLFAEEIFQKTGVDLVMIYSDEKKVSIRRSNEKISCADIAAKLPEGGGHKFAAGAKFQSDPDNRDSIIDELEMAIRKAQKADHLV